MTFTNECLLTFIKHSFHDHNTFTTFDLTQLCWNRSSYNCRKSRSGQQLQPCWCIWSNYILSFIHDVDDFLADHLWRANPVVLVGLIIEPSCFVVWASMWHCPLSPSAYGLAGLASHIFMVVALPPLVARYQVSLLHFTSRTTSVMVVVCLWVTYSNSAPRATQKMED